MNEMADKKASVHDEKKLDPATIYALQKEQVAVLSKKIKLISVIFKLRLLLSNREAT